MKPKMLLALLLLFCIFLPALAQTTPPQPQKTTDDDEVVKITTNLVQVDAVVTKNGKPVANLTAEDFEIFEDGRRQTITSFAYISNVSNTTSQPPTPNRKKTADVVPFTPVKRDDPRRMIALVVDDLGLSAESMIHVRRQLRKFVAEELQPNDLVAVIRTGGELGVLQQFTNDKRLLNRAVEQLRWNICSRMGVSVFPRLSDGGPDEGKTCGGTHYRSMKSLLFIVDSLGYLPGRKSLVLLSDSMPRLIEEVNLGSDGSVPSIPVSTSFTSPLQRIVDRAIRSSVVIYSVDTQGLQYTGLTAADSTPPFGQGSPSLMNSVIRDRHRRLFRNQEGSFMLSKETGGFQVRYTNGFGLDRILKDQAGYYLLGYRPTEETFNRRFHHIKARVKRSGMSLRTRSGFIGVSAEEAGRAQLSRRSSTNLALASPFGAQDIEVNLTSFFANDKAAGSVVRSFVYIDARSLTLEAVNGRRQGSIELHGVIYGDNGQVVEQRSHGATINLAENDYEQAVRNGVAIIFDMPVKKPGSYQVRIATRDRASSKIGTAGQFVNVPDLDKKRLAVSGIVLGVTGFSGRDANQIVEDTGTRWFEPNSDLYFAFVAYNAASVNTPVMEARLFRDEKNVYSGPEVPIAVGNQPDPNRLLVNGLVRLAPDLEPGNYYLQIVITDKTAKNKTAQVVQWIDFEIVKQQQSGTNGRGK